MRAATLPQISWEPLWNIPLPIEGMLPPDDTVTYTRACSCTTTTAFPPASSRKAHIRCRSRRCRSPGMLSGVQRPAHAAAAALGVHAAVRLVAQADFTRRQARQPRTRSCPQHAALRPAARGSPDQGAGAGVDQPEQVQRRSFQGWTFQLDNIRWGILGLRLFGSRSARPYATSSNPAG